MKHPIRVKAMCLKNSSDTFSSYTGELFDAAAGLQNNHHRWYDAAVARWLSEDPLGFAAADANLYPYCANGPLTHTDLLGLRQEGCGAKKSSTLLLGWQG